MMQSWEKSTQQLQSGLEKVTQVSNSATNPFEKLETCCFPLSAPFHLSRGGCKAAGVGGHNVIKEQRVTAILPRLKKYINRFVILQITENTTNELWIYQIRNLLASDQICLPGSQNMVLVLSKPDTGSGPRHVTKKDDSWWMLQIPAARDICFPACNLGKHLCS